MTIRLDKRRVVIQQDGESSDEEVSSEDELVSDEAEKEVLTNEDNSGESASDNSDTEEVTTKTTKEVDLVEADNEEDEDDDDDDDSNVNSDNDEEGGNVNSAWADSISKILKTNKPKKKKTLVLSKAKKLTDPIKEKPKPAGFQVATVDGDVKEEQILEESKKDDSNEPPRKKKKDVLSVRVKPNILNKDRERLLSKIATKGVVQLFNAVKNQQKDISNQLQQAGPLEVRRDKVLKSIDKRSFLDVLMGEKTESVEESLHNQEMKKKVVNEEAGTKATWNVLRDDFMMGAKMKDWDKELEGDDEEEVEEMMESD